MLRKRDSVSTRDETGENMKIIEFIDRQLNKIPLPVMNVINFLATILTILTALGIPTSILAFSFVIDDNSGNIKISAKPIILGCAVLIILLLIRYFNLKKQTMSVQRLVSSKYYSLLHDFRNEINQMELYYKEIEKKKRSWDMAIFTSIVEESLKKGLNCLCETLSIQSGGEKISGCVKHIIGNGNDDINYNNALVMTLVRSENTDSVRKRLDTENGKQTKVFANTDYSSIILGNEHKNQDVFYKQDLKKYDKQLAEVGKHYENTTPHWEDYYRAAIVAPIRIANKKLFYKTENESYDILGFLCLDTMSTNVFTEQQRENFTYTIKAYSAVFYNMMSKYQYYMMKFNEYENIEHIVCAEGNASEKSKRVEQNQKQGQMAQASNSKKKRRHSRNNNRVNQETKTCNNQKTDQGTSIDFTNQSRELQSL